MPHELDYWRNKQPKCPHCSTDFDVWDGDNPLALSYEDEGKTTFECGFCNRSFICVTHISHSFSTAVSEEDADNEDWGPQPVEEEAA